MVSIKSFIQAAPTWCAVIGSLCGAIYFALVEHDYVKAGLCLTAGLTAAGLSPIVQPSPKP